MAKGGRWVTRLREMGAYIYIDTHWPFICSAHPDTQCSIKRGRDLIWGMESKFFYILQFTTELCTIMNMFIINNTVRCMRLDPCYSSLHLLQYTR